MSADCMTVFGFPYISDWMIVEFQDTVPLYRRCVLCGMVASKMTILRCRETVCPPCLQNMKNDDNSFTCPFHKKNSEEKQMQTDESAIEGLANFKVYCFNKSSGCDHVGPFSQLQEHMKLCSYLRVQCQMCGGDMPRCDILTHIVDCADFQADSAPPKEPLTEKEQARFMTKEQMLKELDSLKDSVTEFENFKRSVASERDTLQNELQNMREEFNSFSSEIRVSITECVKTMDDDRKAREEEHNEVGELQLEVESLKGSLAEYDTLKNNLNLIQEQVGNEIKVRKQAQRKQKDMLMNVIKKLEELQTKVSAREQKEKDKKDVTPVVTMQHGDGPSVNTRPFQKAYYSSSAMIDHGPCFISPDDRSEAEFPVDLKENVVLHEFQMGDEDCRFGIQCTKTSTTEKFSHLELKLFILNADCQKAKRWLKNKTMMLQVSSNGRELFNCRKVSLQLSPTSDSIRFLRNEEYMYCATTFKYNFSVDLEYEKLKLHIRVVSSAK